MDDLLPPSTKRQKTEASIALGNPATLGLHGPSLTHEFPVRGLEDFYKPCPTYRLPMEVGAFSIDGEGVLHLDRSQLRYYTPPPQGTRPTFDLRVGYDKFVAKKENVPANKLEPILRWINSNGDCFRPHSNPKSPNSLSQSNVGLKNGELSRSAGIEDPAANLVPSHKERPDDLLTNFVTWRGMITKLLCSPYNRTEPWRAAVTLYKGTVYISEIETEEARVKSENQTPKHNEMCYWGVKFEDYLTSRAPPTPSKPISSSSGASSSKSGTVNPNQAFCTVIRTRMNSHSIVMAAEVDCCDHMSKEKAPVNYIELKTNRVILTDRNKSSFRKYKLMKWWAQSFLVGIPRIVCGFRDDDGVVKQLQNFKTAEIPRETQTDLSMWQPSVCLNFLDELFTWIRKAVTKDDSRVVYILEWNYPYSYVSCTECPPDSQYTFLPNWYLRKHPAPEH